MSSYTDGLILEYLERVANAYENYIAEHNRLRVEDVDSVMMLEIIEARIAFRLATDMQNDIVGLISYGRRLKK